MSVVSHLAQATILNIFNFSLSLAAEKVFMRHCPDLKHIVAPAWGVKFTCLLPFCPFLFS